MCFVAVDIASKRAIAVVFGSDGPDMKTGLGDKVREISGSVSTDLRNRTNQ